MNRSEFQSFINNLNEIWPKSYENQKKNEHLLKLVQYYDYSQFARVFERLVEDNHYAPSISKIKEAIDNVMGANTVIMKEKADFVKKVEDGIVWCKYCASTGLVQIFDTECDPKKGPKEFAMRCVECLASKTLRISKSIPDYQYLITPARYEPIVYEELSPYKSVKNNTRKINLAIDMALEIV